MTPKTIKILYEDANVVVIDKPAGILVHSASFGQGITVAGWVASHYPETKDVGESAKDQKGKFIPRPGIVHRLDKDTSGVLIIAKTQAAFLHLKRQFQDRLVKKVYWALLTGQLVDKGEKVIDLPIGRSSSDARIRVASLKAKGRLRPAKTVYKILQAYHGFTLVEARPETGRTHQLRAHFKALQHPIVCDALYNRRGRCLPQISRQALHAYSLTVGLPEVGQKTFVAPLASDFKLAIDNLELA